MFASVVILAISSVLLAYWVRYTCILLLRNGSIDRETDGTLAFHAFRDGLSASVPGSLEPLHEALNRDYALLTYVIDHGAAALDFNLLERHLLSLDYRMMNFWYGLTCASAPAQAREALREMATIVEFLACRLGSRAGARVRA